MNKFAVILLTVVIVFGIIFVGCAAPAPTAPPTTPTQPTTPTAPTTPTTPTEPTTPTTPAEPAVLDNPVEGVALKPDGTAYTFLQIVPFLWNPVHLATDGVMCNVVEKAGGRYIALDAGGDLFRETSMIEDALIVKPDGVAICYLDGVSELPQTEMLYDAGIPVVTVINGLQLTDSQKYFAHVGYEPYSNGVDCGEWLNEYSTANNVDLHVYAIRGNFAAVFIDGNRFQGLVDSTADNPRIEIISSGNNMWNPDLAMASILDAFPTNPQLNAVFEMGGMGGGVIEAFRQLGKLYPAGDPNHIPFVAIDDVPATCTAIKEGYVDMVAAHNPWDEYTLATYALMNYVCLGKDIPQKDLFLPSYPITKDTLYKPLYGDGRAPAVWGEMYNMEPDYSKWPILTYEDEGWMPTPSVK